MKRRFIDIDVIRDGSKCEPLCVSHASFEQLSAILSLLQPGDDLNIHCLEEDVAPGPGIN